MKKVICTEKSLIVIALLIFQLVYSTSAFAGDAYIRKVVVTNSNDDLVVFFNLDGAFTKSIVDAINNGIPTTFTFLIRLDTVKNAWFDSSVSNIKIYRTIKYDSLKKQYVVTQTMNGENEEELKKTQDFSEAKKAINEFKNIFVVGTHKLLKDTKYVINIKAELEKLKLPFYLEYILFFVSIWDFETSWYVEEFTF